MEGRHVSIGHDCTVYFGVLGLVILLIPGVVGMVGGKRSLEIEWVFNTSDQFPGKSFGSGHRTPPTIWDIDGDGIDEILWGTRRGDSKRLWCIEGDGSFQWIYPPISQEGLGGNPTSKVSLIDVDGDGVLELAFGDTGGRLHVVNPDGSLEWFWDNPTESGIYGPPQAMDIDGDGLVEFFVNDNNGFVYRLNHLGEKVWESRQYDHSMSQPTICDLDRDGRYEVVFSEYHGRVICLDAMLGSLKWIYSAEIDGSINPFVAVMDVNKDGFNEIIAWGEGLTENTGGVYCISYYGTSIWHWPTPVQGHARVCQALGDVDEDGSLEIILTTTYGIYCVDIGGVAPVLRWEINVTEMYDQGVLPAPAEPSHWGNYQLIVDFDGDDKLEVLLQVPYPIVLDAETGEIEACYYNPDIASGRRPENGGAWGDVDNDGKSEWVMDLNGVSHEKSQIYCFTMGGKYPAKAFWAEYSHSAYPAQYQAEQEWLLLKGVSSNSLWFPVHEFLSTNIAVLLTIGLLKTQHGVITSLDPLGGDW